MNSWKVEGYIDKPYQMSILFLHMSYIFYYYI